MCLSIEACILVKSAIVMATERTFNRHINDSGWWAIKQFSTIEGLRLTCLCNVFPYTYIWMTDQHVFLAYGP